MRKTLLTKQMKLQRKELLKWCNKGGYDDNVLKNLRLIYVLKKFIQSNFTFLY